MRVWPLLIIAYPITVHVSILYDVPVVGALLFGTLLLFSLAQALERRSRQGLIWVLSLLGISAALMVWAGSHSAIFLAPVMINASLFLLFARSLGPGATPLITKFADAVRDEMPPNVLRYTRRVTQAWALFSLSLTLQSVLLAVYAPLEIWSLFTNFINYGLVGLFFVVEFGIRRWVLGDDEPKGFFRYLRSLAKVDYRSLMRP